jgi:putative transposase
MSETKIFNKDELLRKMFKLMLESLMEGERSAVLGYEKHDFSGYGSGNSRNGYYERDLLTGLGEFTPELLDKWQRSTKPMDDLVLSLYAKGMTTRDINDVIEKIYGKSYSPQQVTLITKEIEQERLAWEKRPLQQRYIAIFVDCLFVKMRRGDVVSPDAVYVVCGIDSQGHRDILGFYVGTSESATFWKEVLAELRERGVQQVLLFVFDGLTGLETVVKQIFPRALTQLCLVHAVRNSLTYVRPEDKELIARKLKYIYTAKSLSEAKERLLQIQPELKTKYPRLLNRWFDKLPQLMQFLEFPEYVRKHLYSTNWIERLNKDFRKVLKNKNALPTEDAVRNLLYLRVRDIMRRYETQRVNGFGAYQVDLAVMWQKYYGDLGKETGEFTQNT